MPDGRISGLTLNAGEWLAVRDDNGYSGKDTWGKPITRDPIPITVAFAMTVDPGGTLRMIFEDDRWASTISFGSGIPVGLDGTLELMFAESVSPASLIGVTFDLFDWNRVTPAGTFAAIVTEAEAVWDTSNLYTTGQVTLLAAVPEPSTTILIVLGVILLAGAWRSDCA